MALPEARVAGGVSFAPVNYEAEISYEDSWGAKARLLWEAKFGRVAELAATDSEFLYTGLGGAPGGNEGVKMKEFGDGSIVAPYYDLEATFGRVPKVLFLSASALTADHALNLIGLARTYKEEQGVEAVIACLTAVPHERQDHKFPGKDGRPMRQVTTLKDVIRMLTLSIDGGFIIQPHSLRPIEFGVEYGIPLLPIDPFKLMMQKWGVDRAMPGLVLGPDKGRKDEGRMAASYLGWPMASGEKTRDKEGDGTPIIYIPPEVLEFIKQHNLPVYVYDDEIREGGTIGGITRALYGYAEELRVCAVKLICAKKQDGNTSIVDLDESKRPKTAVEYLSHELITDITTTDAVQPLLDVEPIKHKLHHIKVEPDLLALVRFLRRNLVRPGDPTWLRNPQETGTLLRLDLSIEHIEQTPQFTNA